MDSTYLGKVVGHLATLSWETWAVIAGGSTVIWITANTIYNTYFHPLRHFPGKPLWGASTLPWCISLIRGRLIFDVLEMHQNLGPVVRIRPNELSFATAEAWQDIYGHKVLGKKAGLAPGIKELPKHRTFYKAFDAQPDHIVTANREQHAMYRKTLAPGFSEKNLRAQEGLITHYIDLLMTRLREKCASGENKVNLTAWYNYTTFDVIGDLAFGESFGCLEKGEYHPLVSFFLESGPDTSRNIALRYLGFKKLAMVLLFGLFRKGLIVRSYGKKTLKKRMQLTAERPDLIEPALQRKGEKEWGTGSLETLATTLLIAGSETTAASLAGVTWLLVKNPDKLAKLQEEVRVAFKSESEMNFVSVSKLPYLQAVLTEGLRRYPPAAAGFPRVVPHGGATISGERVPENTVVSVYQLAANHLESNWRDPWGFHPERFLGDEQFESDVKESMKPFSYGPRDCIGKNLAYNEMRLIMARMAWNFDMKLGREYNDWIMDQQNFVLWKKGDLDIEISMASR